VILGGICSAVLYPVLGVKCLAFWAASVLLDADHYLEFLYHNGIRNFSLSKAVTFHNILHDFRERAEFINLSIFHTIECLLSVYFLILWLDSPWLRAIFYGMLLHVISDAVYLYRLGIFFKRANSIIEFRIRKSVMERNGIYPRVLYKEALDLTWQGVRN
jgi:hypothetical protein